MIEGFLILWFVRMYIVYWMILNIIFILLICRIVREEEILLSLIFYWNLFLLDNDINILIYREIILLLYIKNIVS